ncbi:CvpA family protein [Pyruvatibacter sp. HU-CL02332]|uniref:CvpA family protein n=1 Tax=Pyruvatibacter sp. HU-CL02332 TaxID=3127650 RepID=UPI0031054C6C
MTGFDAIVIAITLISGLLAMIRGFVREMLSILAWVTAAAAAILTLPYLAPRVREYIDPTWLADGIAAFLVFAIVLVVVSYISFHLGERVPDGQVGALDRTGGFLFGLARGFLLATIAYMFIAWLVAREDFPPWLDDARLLPMVSATAETLTNLVAPNADVTAGSQSAKPRAADKPGTTWGSKPDPQKGDADSEPDDGYNAEERRRLDQLFESVDGNGQE